MISAAYYAHITINFILNNYISQVKTMLSIRSESLSKILITLNPGRLWGGGQFEMRSFRYYWRVHTAMYIIWMFYCRRYNKYVSNYLLLYYIWYLIIKIYVCYERAGSSYFFLVIDLPHCETSNRSDVFTATFAWKAS